MFQSKKKKEKKKEKENHYAGVGGVDRRTFQHLLRE